MRTYSAAPRLALRPSSSRVRDPGDVAAEEHYAEHTEHILEWLNNARRAKPGPVGAHALALRDLEQ